MVNVIIRIRRYTVDFESEQVAVMTRRYPGEIWRPRKLLWNSPRALEARILARKAGKIVRL